MTQGFSLDFNDTFEGGGIADGTYEVLITLASEDATPSGAEYTDFRLTVRNDIQQNHKNQIVFHKNWKAKATGKYNMTMFNTIGKAAQLQKGKSYQSMQDLLADYIGKPLRVTVKNETSEYNGNTYENLNVKKWEPTQFPNVQHVQKSKGDAPQNNGPVGNDPFVPGGGPVIVEDDDLPF